MDKTPNSARTAGISAETLTKYLPQSTVSELPILYKGQESSHFSERELLYKVLFDMRKDVNDLKQLVGNLMQNESGTAAKLENSPVIQRLYQDFPGSHPQEHPIIVQPHDKMPEEPIQEPEEVEESFSLVKKEMDYIRKALQKHEGKRKDAAKELGISERTLYRKIKEYNIE